MKLVNINNENIKEKIIFSSFPPSYKTCKFLLSILSYQSICLDDYLPGNRSNINLSSSFII